MKLPLSLAALAALVIVPGTAKAESAVDYRGTSANQTGKELPAYLQCVPFARAVSGIEIYGDAHSWWGQAEGRYKRGRKPQVGAVMAFEPHRNMQLGHVAAVSKVIDSRTVLLDHANWSPINGRRGQIERNVKAVDVSPNNDWSQVRVWYHPLQGLGKTAWPVAGFIYNERGTLDQPTELVRASAPQPARISDKPSRKFAEAFSGAFTKQAKAMPRRDVVGTIIAGGS
jgi:surface antigen